MGIPTVYSEFNRFDGDYGKFIDNAVDNLHAGPIHNRNYSKSLFQHINNNFKGYLPITLI
jgi:hypothetical protein